MRFLPLISVCLLAAACPAAVGELDVAKAALRDGLWEVARAHAASQTTEEAKLVILESYAGEDRWDAIGRQLAEWPDVKDGRFAYYRAAAAGDYAKAAKLLAETGGVAGAAESRMLEAGLRVKAGDFAGARNLWAAVTASSNASERAFAVAAANLGAVAPLRKAYASVKSPELRRMAGLRLGMALMQDAKGVDEGVRLVRAIVKDAPDAPGAQEAFVALAETALAASRWQDAADAYHEAVETWPDVAKLAQVQEGRGWALLKLGRHEEALEAFVRAEKLAGDDSMRATAILKQGDVLSELGRGEESMARYRTVLEKYPKTSVAEKLKNVVRVRELEARGRDLYREYRFAEAAKAFAEVGAADSARKPRMAYFEVLCLYGQGLDEEAGRKAGALVENCPNPKVRAEAMLWLAKFLYNRGEWKESARLFAAFAGQEPDSAQAAEALTWSARAAFAENDFASAIQRVTRLVERYPDSPMRSQALLVQGESLIELARFDEAVLVLEGVAISETALPDDRMRAQILKADALFAMGADNPARYQAALDAYRAVRFGGALSAGGQLSVSFKIAKTLEKLKRIDEAIDQYYTQVVLVYREGREKGERFDDEARVVFSRAAFRLADEYESRGRDVQALNILELVADSDVPAAEEAAKRIERLSKKGRFL